MKQNYKWLNLLIGLCLALCVFAGCNESVPPHECGHVCPTCGKCTDETCDDPVCAEKCEGHETAQKKYTLKVMSVNLDQGLIEKSEQCIERIASVNPDVIGVQEESTQWKKALTDEMESYGYSHVCYFRGGPQGYDEACGIFYNYDRFELLDQGAFSLSPTPDKIPSTATEWGAMYPRVCNWVELKDKDSGFVFAYFNTHYDYATELSKLNSSKLIIERAQALGVPTFFSGDLNFAYNEEKNEETYSVLTSFFDDSRQTAAETDQGITFNNYGSPTENGKPIYTAAIDYIFYTKGDFTPLKYEIIPEKVEGQWTSDHYPIVSTFEYTME